MNDMIVTKRLAAICLLATSMLVAPTGPARAGQPETDIQGIVVFGASLSDVGNVHLVTADSGPFIPIAQPPYFQGRFTNGPVWHEVMADRMGLMPASVPSLLGGDNYAWGGAEVGPGFAELIGVPNVGTQIALYLGLQAGLGQLPLSENQLFIVASGGGNNLLPPGSPGDPRDIVRSLENHVITLAEAGARHFLVPNFFSIERAPILVPLLVSPNVLPPGVQSVEDAETILALAHETNHLLRPAMQRLERRLDRQFGGVTITYFDMRVATRVITNAPQLFGIEDTTGRALNPLFPACFCTGTIEAGVDPDRYFWFDVIHPTARVHEVLGELAAALLQGKMNVGLLPPGELE